MADIDPLNASLTCLKASPTTFTKCAPEFIIYRTSVLSLDTRWSWRSDSH
jgi:hypothetical protein